MHRFRHRQGRALNVIIYKRTAVAFTFVVITVIYKMLTRTGDDQSKPELRRRHFLEIYQSTTQHEMAAKNLHVAKNITLCTLSTDCYLLEITNRLLEKQTAGTCVYSIPWVRVILSGFKLQGSVGLHICLNGLTYYEFAIL